MYTFVENSFYRNSIYLLGLDSIRHRNLLYILNKNLKNKYWITCDNKQMIRLDDIRYMPSYLEKPSKIKFHPLNEQKESCNYLIKGVAT